MHWWAKRNAEEKPLHYSDWCFELSPDQARGVSIVVIGVGKDLYKRKEQMKWIAGKKGKVLLYGSFDALIKSLNQILQATCRKFISGFL